MGAWITLWARSSSAWLRAASDCRIARLVGLLLREGPVVGRLGAIEIALRHQALAGQLAGALVLLPRVGDRRGAPLRLSLRRHEVGAHLRHARFERRGVEPRDDLPALDDRVEIGSQARDRARHLGPDLDRRDSLKQAGGADDLGDVSSVDDSRLEASSRAARAEARQQDPESQDRQNGHAEQPEALAHHL
jgi:hypothetical protein